MANTLRRPSWVKHLLKGQCHEIFCFRFFSGITFPQAPDNNSRIISNFFENSRRYSQVKVHHRWQICHIATGVNDTGINRRQICHRYQRHRWQICHRCRWSPCVVDTGGKFATGVNDTGGKFAAGGKLPPVSTTLAANLPPVSLTPVANNGNNIRLQTPENELEGKNLNICFLHYP
jgi:hypothetical protein